MLEKSIWSLWSIYTHYSLCVVTHILYTKQQLIFEKKSLNKKKKIIQKTEFTNSAPKIIIKLKSNPSITTRALNFHKQQKLRLPLETFFEERNIYNVCKSVHICHIAENVFWEASGGEGCRGRGERGGGGRGGMLKSEGYN